MARPLSEEKRNALLAAATSAVASSGVAASTIKIAKDACVAEGTLFVYFPTKDDLLNQLFLHLKSDLRGFLAADYPADGHIQEQIQHLWNRLVDWGARSPDKRKALRQLKVSEKITEASQNAGQAMFYDFVAVVENGFKTGILREQPLSFLGGVTEAIADMVLESASRDPAKLDHYKFLGWQALWGALARQ
ncbi:MAG: TetR/AcrR family transcriptional regulator [Rhodospirillales bacterium]|jgi:AcrR family transcriptional regulator|nr:TetR/AcrR family transcriptional regulator [Rhodospirillales bacterium]